jgi:hypothetical protein
MIMVATAQSRAFFGAGVFLFTGILQEFAMIRPGEGPGDLSGLLYAAGSAAIAVMFIFMTFEYVDSGTDLARIYREENERAAYLDQMKQAGEKNVTVPMLRPDFDNKYTFAYELDISKDPDYWLNQEMASYYDLESVRGVPREGWTKY